VRLAIRKNMRDFIAILFVALLGGAVAFYVLSNQRLNLPAWVPGIGSDFYTVRAELPSAQAVVPGQGQTVNVAGVSVGDIGNVELRDGRAVVELKIDRKYAPIYRDASALLRSKTGLKDMYVALDPGSRSAGELPEGGRVELSTTLPDVNPDEILAELDGDTRAYLQILLNAGGQAFTDSQQPGRKPQQSAAQDLRETLKRFEPTSRDLAKITGRLAERRRNLRRVIHNFQELSTALASRDDQLGAFVDSANANFAALAGQDANLREAVRLLPGALGETQGTLRKVSALAADLGPTLGDLRPFARGLGPALRETRPFLRATTPIIRDQLRPFAREARPAVRDLRPTARDLAVATPRLTRSFGVLNTFLNMLAYNPQGREEGFLFWLSWGGHLGTSVFNIADSSGPIRRTIVSVDCTGLPVAEAAGAIFPAAGTLFTLTNLPKSSEVCG
jgi:phospholipid/cholesterol/gamma-HCH transport system substrate-binding protein